MKVDSHVSPYKRIEIGPRPYVPAPAPDENDLARRTREEIEKKRHIEHLRIWNHLVQTAQGCNPGNKGQGQ